MAHLQDILGLIRISVRALLTTRVRNRHMERSYSRNRHQNQIKPNGAKSGKVGMSKTQPTEA